MVGALVETGVIHRIGQTATNVTGDNHFVAASGLLLGSAVLGAFFDNILYTTAMAPMSNISPSKHPRPTDRPGSIVVLRPWRRTQRQQHGPWPPAQTSSYSASPRAAANRSRCGI
jgi:hypothetical protein